MSAHDLRHWQSERDRLHRSSLDEAVASLDEADRGNEPEAKIHLANACVALGRAAKAARLARVGEMSTQGDFRAPEESR